jgi:hypothetical protein
MSKASVQTRKIGNVWILEKNQPKPKKYQKGGKS